MWKHPKYYKELRKLRNKLDQAISDSTSCSGADSVRPDPGLKQQASSTKRQAEASSFKLSNQPVQSSSNKRQALRHKPQASSHKQQAS